LDYIVNIYKKMSLLLFVLQSRTEEEEARVRDLERKLKTEKDRADKMEAEVQSMKVTTLKFR